MPLMTLHHQRVPAGRRQRLPNRVRRCQARPCLVLIGDFHRLRMLHSSRIRHRFAKEKAHQRRLASAVWANNPDPVPAQNLHRQVIDDLQAAIRRVETVCQALHFDHFLAHGIACIGGDRRGIHPIIQRTAHLRVRLTHLIQLA